MPGEAVDSLVVDQGLAGQGRAQHQAFEGAAAAQRDVGLAVGEGAADVDHGAVEGQSLALVHGDRPGELQGILAEDAVDGLAYLLGLLVEFVARVGPFLLPELEGLSAVLAAHLDSVGGEFGDLAQHAVEVAVCARRVVLHEHYLRSAFERQFAVGGEGGFGELAFGLGAEGEGLSGELVELFGVDALGLPVVGHEADAAFAGDEAGLKAAVEGAEGGGVAAVLAYPVEYVEEAGVVLTVDGPELDGAEFAAPEGLAGEEVGAVVVFGEQLPLFVAGDRGELLEVAYQQHLHAAEGTAAVTVAAQHVVDRVEQVGPDHADLVDHEKVEAADEVGLVLAETVAVFRVCSAAEAGFGNVGREGQLEEGVYGHSAGVDGSDSCRREHHHALGVLFLELAQEGGLPGSCLAGEEEVRPRVHDEVPCEGQFGVHLLSSLSISVSWEYSLR